MEKLLNQAKHAKHAKKYDLKRHQRVLEVLNYQQGEWEKSHKRRVDRITKFHKRKNSDLMIKGAKKYTDEMFDKMFHDMDNLMLPYVNFSFIYHQEGLN